MADTSIDYQTPTPDPALKQLDFLVGEWDLKGTMKESAFGPAGVIEGWHKWEWKYNGFFLVHTWKQELGEGIEFIGYDAANKRFETHYFDTNGPYDEAGSTYKGEMRGKSYVQVGPARITYTPSDDGKTIKFTSDMPKDLQPRQLNAPDSNWVEWLEGTYTKIG